MKRSLLFTLVLLTHVCLLADDQCGQSDNNFNYRRIGRFSDEDYFDMSSLNDVIASAPGVIKKIIINLLYPPKNRAALP